MLLSRYTTRLDGYSIIYIDTEMSIELGDLTNHKIDITL